MSTGLRNTTLRSPSKRKPRAAVDAKEVIKSEKSIPAKGEIILPSMLISMRIPIIKKSYDESYLDLHPNKIQTPVYTRRHPMYQMFKKKKLLVHLLQATPFPTADHDQLPRLRP